MHWLRPGSGQHVREYGRLERRGDRLMLSLALANGRDCDREQALAWLERGIQAGDHKVDLVKVDPKWNSFHGDPRFEDLMRRIGF